MAEPPVDSEEIRKRATRRLIVAVLLIGLAAGVLTWLSHYKPTPPVTRPAAETVPPPPIIAAEPAPPAAPAPEAPPAEQTPAPSAEQAPAAAPAPPPPETPAAPPPPAPAGKAPAEAPPPPKVVAKPLAPPPPAKPAEAVKPLVRAEPAPTPPPPAHPPAGYVVQFGVFNNPQNALQLVERLRAAGIEAQTETRVMLPPFKTRAEAEAALARLKEKGISAVIVQR
jgi:DedD protein